jgi:long-chain acyl-CoA synthetase
MSKNTDRIITPDEAVTLHGLFLERVKRSPDQVAYRHFNVAQNEWQSFTWAQMLEQVARWQGALQSEGLVAGDRVALMLRNCPQWIMFEQAAMSLGLVVVPLYTVDRPDNIAYIVKDAGVKVLLFENGEQWQALRTVADQMDCVQRLVSLDKVSESNDPRLKCADTWLPAKAAMLPARERKRDELATIIYTSGTTGKPKGVMLSHHNIVYNAYASCLVFPVDQNDCALSFLPLSHTFERTASYWLMIGGARVAYARSIPLLAEDLQIIRPTVLIAVPRIFERIYNAIHAKLEEASPLKKKLFMLTVETGWDRFEYQQGRGAWKPGMLLWPVLKHLVADKVIDRLGGRIRFSISGGAALPPKVSRLFIALGLKLIQGYGMTETSPVVSANRGDQNHPSSVGLPLPGVSVKVVDLETEAAEPARQCHVPPRTKIPRGRTSRATMISEKMTSGAVEGDQAADTTPASAPTTIPASRVPTALPIPPRMTTAKTIPNHSNGADGVRGRSTATSMPATAAVAPATPPSRTPSRTWSMPKAAAIVRSWANARSARPG